MLFKKYLNLFCSLGRLLYVHSADAYYCVDPRLLVEPVDGIEPSLRLIPKIVSNAQLHQLQTQGRILESPSPASKRLEWLPLVGP